MGLSAASKRQLLKDSRPQYAREASNKPIKKMGTYKGKSNRLGYGGRSAQLKDRGVPGGVIGNLARAAHAAPGQKNYHGSRKA